MDLDKIWNFQMCRVTIKSANRWLLNKDIGAIHFFMTSVKIDEKFELFIHCLRLYYKFWQQKSDEQEQRKRKQTAIILYNQDNFIINLMQFLLWIETTNTLPPINDIFYN